MEVSRAWKYYARQFLVGVLVGAALVGFVLVVQADTDVIRPDGVGTLVAGTAVGCTSSLRWECLNEVVTQPTAPDTGTDYLQQVNGETNHSLLGTFTDVSAVTALTIWIYHREGGTNARTSVGLYDTNETTAFGAVTTLTNRTSGTWDSVTYSSLSLTQTQLNNMRLRVACGKVGGGASTDCFAYAAYVDVTFNPVIEITVGTAGTQQNINIGTNNAHVGGSFAITESVSSRNVTSVTINETGTVNGQTNLDNIRLYYEFDTSTPYNCVSETYAGTESLYGSSDTDGFSGANGSSVFTGSQSISPTQALCLYPVVDVLSSAAAAETIEIQITNPTTDVAASGSDLDITPATAVAIGGTSVILAQKRDQIHYHWRNDNGSEAAATSATGGTDDTVYSTLAKLATTRLRLQVSNEGNRTSDATPYRLEYGRKISICQNVVSDSSWVDVGAVGGDWDMSNSANLTDGNNTTDIAEAIGGMANENTTFLSPNAAIKDTSSQTANITLTSTQFVEAEYSITSTASATEGNTYCFRLTNAGTAIETYTVYPEATILADVNVSSSGTERPTVDIPTADIETGARFILTDNIAGNTTVQSITLTASGTIDMQNDVNNIELRYDLDTSAPYNCVSETFGGSESLFGSTDTNGFSVSNTSTFTGSQVINPTQTMCVYVIYDIDSDTTDGELLDIKIQNAGTDVVLASGTVSPTALVDLSGTTKFVTDTTAQVHYHWRDDNGSESGATSATGGTEDTLQQNLRAGVPTRLRLGMANEGSSTTPAYQYRLEYALKLSTCNAASGWTDVGATNDAFNMFNSANITEGADTTNIAVSSGGVTDVGNTFFSDNNAVKDTSSQTAALTLPGKNFTDLEYSVVASSTATEGATYCFRVTNAGTSIDRYDVYPEVLIKPKTDFFIQRGVTTVSGTGVTITAGTDYVAPASSSTAFIRIVGTNNTGAGSPTNSGSADDVTAYISNPSNITSSITFTRPATAADTTRVAWEIIEYVGAPGGDNEIVVRNQAAATYGGANTEVTTGAAAGVVDDADMAVFITGHGNPDTGLNYPYSLSTAAWNSGADTVTFTRGATGNAAVVSYAAVEFVGANWRVQRSEHTYSAVGTTQTENITAVNSLSRTFLHDQKRVGSGLNTHSNYGHNVFLSGLGQVSYVLEAGATSPASHVSVAWVIENIQTVGDTMIVSRSNGSESTGSMPKTVNVDIGPTISDTQDASLFLNNHGNEAGGGSSQNSFPEPIISPSIISEDEYQLWIADPDNDTRTWRAEVVEWPTASRDITQNYYRFYVNNNALDPTDPWPAGAANVGENTEVTLNDGPIEVNDVVRLRMTAVISSAGMEPGIDTFILQYAERVSTCDALGEAAWLDVGASGSTTALWRGTSTPLTDGASLSTDPPAGGALNISVSDVAGTFEEENPSAVTPYIVDPGEDVEFDWAVQHNGAKQKTTYCFRMLEASGTLFDDYLFYPAMRTAGYTPILSQWRWYDDATSTTPTAPLAGENISPSNVEFDNVIKLRTTIAEMTGGAGTNIKYKLQFSESSNFSVGVYDVMSSSTCASLATTTAQLWCYDDGAGIDNAVINAAVLSDADSCSGGVGAGCGTHNEGTATSTATYDQPGLSTAEYEFTLRHDGARANTVYYFRVFDLTNATTVAASSSWPSLQVAGAELVFTNTGVDTGVATEGIVTDAATGSSTITFGTLPFDSEFEVAYRLNVDTDATEGYQVLMVSDQAMQDGYGTELPPVVGTNASPVGWSTGCSGLIACFGYHAGDDSLFGGSSRFAPDNSYAAINETTYEEVAYSSVPVNEYHDIVFKTQVSELQPAGLYTMGVSFIVIPVF